MRIAVIDGQGGGIGRTIIERIRELTGTRHEIIALGTNALATASMMKAGADMGASGDNAIAYNAKAADVIMGPVAILSANSLLGEISPAVACAVGESPAAKILIPLNKCNLHIAGLKPEPLPNLIDAAIEILKTLER